MVDGYVVNTLSILLTLQCTASCNDCGSFSSPRTKKYIDDIDMLRLIGEARDVGIKLVVFSGGEATLRWKSLLSGIRMARAEGLRTRLVTNAWWASDDERSFAYMEELYRSGLDEINVSSGDEHVRFIPIVNAVRAIRAALARGVKALVMIESRAGRVVTERDFIESLELRGVEAGALQSLQVISSPWMPLDVRRLVDYPSGLLADASNVDQRRGCADLFSTVTVAPDGRHGMCCGIGAAEIPALQYRNEADEGYSLLGLSSTSNRSFLRMLVKEVGPERVLSIAGKLESSFLWEGLYGHKCHACRRIFLDDRVRKIVDKNKEVFAFELASEVVSNTLAEA